MSHPPISRGLVQIHYRIVCALFYTSIMSPLSLRYANVGSFSNFSLSIYDKSLIPESSFVALLWTFSVAILCFILYGYHTATAYSR